MFYNLNIFSAQVKDKSLYSSATFQINSFIFLAED